MKKKAAAKFAPLIVGRAAEGLDMMRIEDLKSCGIKQSANEVSALSAQEK